VIVEVPIGLMFGAIVWAALVDLLIPDRGLLKGIVFALPFGAITWVAFAFLLFG
jgi:hypothetical protein